MKKKCHTRGEKWGRRGTQGIKSYGILDATIKYMCTQTLSPNYKSKNQYVLHFEYSLPKIRSHWLRQIPEHKLCTEVNNFCKIKSQSKKNTWGSLKKVNSCFVKELSKWLLFNACPYVHDLVINGFQTWYCCDFIMIYWNRLVMSSQTYLATILRKFKFLFGFETLELGFTLQ